MGYIDMSPESIDLLDQSLTVARVSDTPGIEYKATYRNGSARYGRYAATKEEAVAKIRRQYNTDIPYEEVTFAAYCGTFTDGEVMKTAPDGIIVLDSDLEAERGKQAFINDEVFDYSAQSVYFQEAYKEEWFLQTNPPNYGDYVDLYFDEFLTELSWRYDDQKRAETSKSVESAAQNFAMGIAIAVLIGLVTFGMVVTKVGDLRTKGQILEQSSGR